MRKSSALGFGKDMAPETPRELIKNILAFLNPDKGLPDSQTEIHLFFFNLKNKYPKLMSKIFFTDDPNYPFSQEVDQVLINLQDSSFLARPNPALNKYVVKFDSQKRIKKLSHGEKHFYENVAKDLQKFLEN